MSKNTTQINGAVVREKAALSTSKPKLWKLHAETTQPVFEAA